MQNIKILIDTYRDYKTTNKSGLILPITAILLAIVIIAIATIAFYVWHRSPKIIQSPLRKPIKISTGELNDTYTYNGEVFPNLPQGYQFIYRYTSSNGLRLAEYLTSKSTDDVKYDMRGVCITHKFTFEPNSGSGNVECIDTKDSWLFTVAGSTDIQNQTWYKSVSQQLSSYYLTSSWTWLEVESSGAPIYN